MLTAPFCNSGPGRCSEVERDRIEEQVGRYMRSCTANIARLEASIKADQPGVRSLNPHMIVHRHGVVSNVPSSTSTSPPYFPVHLQKSPCWSGD